MLKRVIILSVVSILGGGAAFAAPQILTGSAAVNVTSDTAAAAKNIAFDNARRQIIGTALAPYTDRSALGDAIKDAPAAALTNLVATSSIDGEQQSATTYSANITMTLDGGAVRRWLADNNVNSWLPDNTVGDQVIVLVTLRDKVGDWMQLNQIARGENVELNTRNISGNQMTISIPESGRRMFAAAARSAGWQTSDDGGALRMWK
ncbi:MAG: hypothetical protein K2I81_02760 [Alphaproteobacteria bacterium]|nr:hypothetical protein [Alphaproteobacteria bacterium]